MSTPVTDTPNTSDASAASDGAGRATREPTPSLASRRIGRAALLGLCLAAGLAVARPGAAPGLLSADPELARLLRAMAVIKAVMVAPALAFLWWRFALPLALAQAAGYLAGCASMLAACVAIWQLAFLVPAACAFHLGLLALLLGAWSDRPLLAALRPAAR